MNYTIIGHTEDHSHYDRRGDFIFNPGEFKIEFFREDKEEFLKAWAQNMFTNAFEDFIILLDGVPDGELDDAEYEKYEALELEMTALLLVMKAKHEAAEQVRKEAAANAAAERARQMAAQERARDLAQLEALQQKLGVR